MKKIAADRNYKKAFRLQQDAATMAEVRAEDKKLSDRLSKVERILHELWTWKNTVAAQEAQSLEQ